ncbi:DnaJ domain-containing protein [Coprinopsis sp. MPI-PUGE-AT-0042]|nr:DnaJ domain-containing protein [Coprinopsis sp. MPI-PUGE-AT-0042]
MPLLKRATFYDILALDKSATTDEVRKAYRKRVLETHPDKLDPSATEDERQAAQREFQKVHEAFETLGDPQKKRRYDAGQTLRLDPELVSQHSARLAADRREWARQQAELHQRRMEDYKARLENGQASPRPTPATTPSTPPAAPKSPPAMTRQERELKKANDLLGDLLKAHPEFAARRRVALQRKAEREKADREKARLKAQEPPATA